MPKNQKYARPTMRDVAKQAGVSPALVSIVFRNAPGASQETRKRVLAAAKKIGYVRDEQAALLRASTPTDVGVFFENGQPFHHELIEAMYQAIYGTGYNLFLSVKSARRSEEDALQALLSHRCGALILIGSELADAELAAINRQIPTICLARQLSNPQLHWVCSDDYQGMQLAVEYLYGQGHRHIGFLQSPGAAANLERKRSFEDFVATHPEVKGSIWSAGNSEAAGAEAARALLALEPGQRPTGIVAFNDHCAKGMMDLCLQSGLRIPEDLSVVGIDGSELAARSYVQLTTLAQDTAQIGRLAIEQAIGQIEARFAGAATPSTIGAAASTTTTSAATGTTEVTALGDRVEKAAPLKTTTGIAIPMRLIERKTVSAPADQSYL